MPFKIYYLDDEPFLLEIFTETFSSPDVQVVTFVDPNDALLEIKESPPNVFFVDYRLPNTTGDQLAHEVPTGIPIVLVTGDINVRPRFPFSAIFEKPLDVEAIQGFIDSLRFKKVQPKQEV